MKPLKETKPAVSILSEQFNYVNAANTDIKKTFARAFRAMRQKESEGKVINLRKERNG